MIARVAAFLLWALAVGSAVFWGLRLAAQPLPVPAQATPASTQAGSGSAVTRMLGSTATAAVAEAPPPESSRFKLVGALAPVKAGTGPGVALIGVDGKPARAYALGARVSGDLVLQSLTQRSAALGPAGGQPAFTLDIPRLPPAQTGVLAPAAEDDEDSEGPATSTAPAIPPRPAAAPRPAVPPPPPVTAPPTFAQPPAAAPPPGVAQPQAIVPAPAVPQQPVPPQPARPLGATPPGAAQPGWSPSVTPPGTRPPPATQPSD